MTTQVNKTVKSGSAMGSALEFFTLTASSQTLNQSSGQPALNVIIETISTIAQPVIIDVENGTTVKFAVEHAAALGDGSAMATKVAAALLAALNITSTVACTKAVGL